MAKIIEVVPGLRKSYESLHSRFGETDLSTKFGSLGPIDVFYVDDGEGDSITKIVVYDGSDPNPELVIYTDSSY